MKGNSHGHQLPKRSSPTPTQGPPLSGEPALARWSGLPALRQRRSGAHRQLKGKASHRPGLYHCNECREHFTVTVGTVFERSKIAADQLAARNAPARFVTRRACRAHQLHRMLGVTYKTAWFMAHRIREAMKRRHTPARSAAKARSSKPTKPTIGKRERHARQRSAGPSLPSAASVAAPEAHRRCPGRARRQSPHVPCRGRHRGQRPRHAGPQRRPRQSTLYTDESRLYTETGEEFAEHRTVNHAAGEYVRYEDDGIVHTNTIENVFSRLQARHEWHLSALRRSPLAPLPCRIRFPLQPPHRAWLRPMPSAPTALKGIEGKRLTYRRIGEAANA